MRLLLRLCCLVLLNMSATPNPVQAQSAELMQSYRNSRALRKAGKYSEAIPHAERALELGEKEFGPSHRHVGTFLNNLAELHRAQGNYPKVGPLYRRSLKIYEKTLGPDHAYVGTSLNNLALLYSQQGRFREAEPLYRRSLNIREKTLGPEHPTVGQSLNNLAFLFFRQGRYSEAEPLYRRSLKIRIKTLGPDHPDVGRVSTNLAELYRVQGRFREALSLFSRSLKIREVALGPDHPDTGTSLNNLARFYSSQGHYRKAGPLYRRSLKIYEKALGPDHPYAAAGLTNLAALYFAQRDWRAAADHWRQATGVLTRRAKRDGKIGQGAAGKKRSEVARHSLQFRNLIKSVFRELRKSRPTLPNINEMFKTAQWALGSEAASSLAQMAARGAAGDPALAKVVRERQDLVAEWQARDKLRIAAFSKPANKRGKKSEAENSSRLAAIDKRLAAIDVQLVKDFPDYAALVNPRPLSISEVQGQLGHDEVLVLFLDTPKAPPTPEETFIWSVTRTQSRWVRIDKGTTALKREVAALRCGLDRDGAWDWAADKRKWIAKSKLCRNLWPEGLGAQQPLPFDAVRAHKLYTALFGKIKDLIKGKKLLIVPSGPLTTLPFQVLVTQEPDAASVQRRDYAKVSWLARHHAITVLPSVASLKSLRKLAKTSKASKPFIGFGNPLLEGDAAKFELAKTKRVCRFDEPKRVAGLLDRIKSALNYVGLFRGGSELADVAAIRRQNALPETADELCAIARTAGALPSSVHLAGQATEDQVKTLSAQGHLAEARVIEFATHGLLAREAKFLRTNKAEPGLILTPPNKATSRDDGFLTASEITTLKLDADWVILSACNTAGGNGAGNAEALSGLARAFFYAGARALLVSHWYVNSNAAVSLTTGALTELKTNPKIGRAEALRRSMLALVAKGGANAHPSYWAPFIVVGEGGAGR